MERLRIPAPVADAILAHAREGAPREVCGILAGRLAPREALRAIPVRNVHPDPRRGYKLDPEEQLRATLALEEEGFDVVGFYHSHPSGPARHSAIDEAEAAWPGASFVLAHLAPREGLASARCEAPGRLVAEEILTARSP